MQEYTFRIKNTQLFQKKLQDLQCLLELPVRQDGQQNLLPHIASGFRATSGSSMGWGGLEEEGGGDSEEFGLEEELGLEEEGQKTSCHSVLGIQKL